MENTLSSQILLCTVECSKVVATDYGTYLEDPVLTIVGSDRGMRFTHGFYRTRASDFYERQNGILTVTNEPYLSPDAPALGWRFSSENMDGFVPLVLQEGSTESVWVGKGCLTRVNPEEMEPMTEEG